MGKKKASNSATESPADASAPPATKTFQSFERATAMRSQLRFHESNPRSIDAHAFKKLKENIKRAGLVTSLIVNRRTAENGFLSSQAGQLVIVGGHQRCKAMDDLRGYDPATGENDYQIPIDLLCINSAREREILISLNNSALQGTFDLDILSDLLTTPELDWKATGFDKLELRSMLDSGICDQILGEQSPQGAAEAPVIAAIAEIAADSKEYKKAQEQQLANSASPALATSTPAGTVPPSASQTAPPARGDDINSVEAIKGRRYDFRDKTANAGAESHITLVANSSEEIEQLLSILELPVMETFFALDDFLDRCVERIDLLTAPDDADPAGPNLPESRDFI